MTKLKVLKLNYNSIRSQYKIQCFSESEIPQHCGWSWSNSTCIISYKAGISHKKLLRKKKSVYNVYKKLGKAGDKLKYWKFQIALKTKLRSAQDEYIANTLDCALKEKPKKFLWWIKYREQGQIGIPPLNAHGKVLIESTSEPGVLSNHFQQIFPKKEIVSIPRKGCSDFPAVDSVIFNREGIINLLNN